MPLGVQTRDPECVIDPDEVCIAAGDGVATVEHASERKPRPGDVVDAADAALRTTDDPGGGVAGVDELDETIGRAWRKDAATACNAVGPVGKPPAPVVCPDEEP